MTDVIGTKQIRASPRSMELFRQQNSEIGMLQYKLVEMQQVMQQMQAQMKNQME